MLCSFSDGSVLRKIKAKELVGVPVWKGNRFIDLAHAELIKSAIGGVINALDSTIFRLVKYKDSVSGQEQTYLVDGQHRQHVIKKYYEEHYILPINFDVMVHEKTVDSESEAIEYFNAINNVKPQQDNDPKMLANKYILALEKKFVKLIRPEGKATKRPFLSNDLLRVALEGNAGLLRQGDAFVRRFIERVDAWNTKRIRDYELGLIERREETVLDTCLKKKFILAFDARLPWVKECLSGV
jgi:hypothetical protein